MKTEFQQEGKSEPEATTGSVGLAFGIWNLARKAWKKFLGNGPSWTWRDIFRILEVVVLVIAAGAGVKACGIYQSQNELHAFKSLVDADIAMLNTTRRTPHMEAFFVELPRDIPAHERADLCIRLIAGEPYSIRQWKDIPDLLCLVYEEEDFYHPAKVRLREAFGVAEEVLYLLNNAFNYKEEGLLNKEDYDTWVAYLRDIGDHPLFLAAVHYWHASYYMPPGFAAELKQNLQELKDKPSIWQNVSKIYPEMTRDDWASRAGKVAIKCRTNPNRQPNPRPSLDSLIQAPLNEKGQSTQ